jgi:hypothetical protein
MSASHKPTGAVGAVEGEGEVEGLTLSGVGCACAGGGRELGQVCGGVLLSQLHLRPTGEPDG